MLYEETNLRSSLLVRRRRVRLRSESVCVYTCACVYTNVCVWRAKYVYIYMYISAGEWEERSFCQRDDARTHSLV